MLKGAIKKSGLERLSLGAIDTRITSSVSIDVATVAVVAFAHVGVMVVAIVGFAVALPSFSWLV